MGSALCKAFFLLCTKLFCDDCVELFNEFVNVDAVHRSCLFESFAVREHAMQAVHTTLLQHFCEFIGIALCEYVDDEHVFCYHGCYLLKDM